MSNKSSFPGDQPGRSEFSVEVPRRHDAIGRALDNAYARATAHDIPSDMAALLAQLDQQLGGRGASD